MASRRFYILFLFLMGIISGSLMGMEGSLVPRLAGYANPFRDQTIEDQINYSTLQADGSCQYQEPKAPSKLETIAHSIQKIPTSALVSVNLGLLAYALRQDPMLSFHITTACFCGYNLAACTPDYNLLLEKQAYNHSVYPSERERILKNFMIKERLKRIALLFLYNNSIESIITELDLSRESGDHLSILNLLTSILWEGVGTRSLPYQSPLDSNNKLGKLQIALYPALLALLVGSKVYNTIKST